MKPALRKEIESFILKYVDKIDVSKTNGNMYRKVFKSMSDKDLEKLCSKPLPIYAPNGGPVKIDHYKNIEICKELGHDPEQYCWLTDPKTNVTSRTKFKHLVLPLPVRRQTQLVEKKISISEHNRTIDKTTGQATGASKSSSFSFPQVYVMYSKGYDSTIKELMQIRGGNIKAGKVIDRNLRQTGSSSQKFEGSEKTRVKSTVVLGIIFTCMHLGNNL